MPVGKGKGRERLICAGATRGGLILDVSLPLQRNNQRPHYILLRLWLASRTSPKRLNSALDHQGRDRLIYMQVKIAIANSNLESTSGPRVLMSA